MGATKYLRLRKFKNIMPFFFNRLKLHERIIFLKFRNRRYLTTSFQNEAQKKLVQKVTYASRKQLGKEREKCHRLTQEKKKLPKD